MISLQLYQPVILGSSPVGEIGDMIDPRSYWHSSRNQGGYWQAGGTIRNQPLSVLEDIFYTALACDFRETCLGLESWRGMVATMRMRRNARFSRTGAELDIDFLGYAHTAQFREVTVGDMTSSDINVWLEELVTGNCEFIDAGAMVSNTLKLPKGVEGSRKVWDEMKRIYRLGDANGDLWRIYVKGTELFYEPIDFEPRYRARAAFERQRSLLDMENYIRLDYVADDTRIQASYPDRENELSSGIYGRREGKLQLSNVSGPTAAARQWTYLKEFGWPWARPSGSSPGLEVLALNDEVLPPWIVEAGVVVRDMAYQVERVEYGGFFDDARDALIEEVRASAGGVVLSATEFTADDILTKAAYGGFFGSEYEDVRDPSMAGWVDYVDQYRSRRKKGGRGTFLPDYDPERYGGRTDYWFTGDGQEVDE